MVVTILELMGIASFSIGKVLFRNKKELDSKIKRETVENEYLNKSINPRSNLKRENEIKKQIEYEFRDPLGYPISRLSDVYIKELDKRCRDEGFLSHREYMLYLDKLCHL